MDFGAIWGGFGGSFGRLEAILGVPGRVPEASPKGVFDRLAPRKFQSRFGIIFGSFWMDLGGHFGGFGQNFQWILLICSGQR